MEDEMRVDVKSTFLLYFPLLPLISTRHKCKCKYLTFKYNLFAMFLPSE